MPPNTFGYGLDSPGGEEDPYGLSSLLDFSSGSDAAPQVDPQSDPQSLYQKIQAQRAALDEQEKALLSRPAASSIPMSREQMLGAALQAALPVITGYAAGGNAGGALGANYASETVPELFKGFEAQNQDEANRKDKLDQFIILQKERALANQEDLATSEQDATTKLQNAKELIDYKEQAKGSEDPLKTKDKLNAAIRTSNTIPVQKMTAMEQAREDAITAAADSSPASNTKLIEAFGKALGQPNMTLREMAVKMAERSQQPMERVLGELQNVFSHNGTLTDRTKQDMLGQVKNSYESARKAYVKNTSAIRENANAAGLNPDEFLPSFPEFPEDRVISGESSNEWGVPGKVLNVKRIK